MSESEILTNRMEAIKNKLINLESENLRLLFIKDNLLDGILFTEGLNNQNDIVA